MATSRRRERELARRRYERRRQAELERRARAKRRNTIIGATSGTAVVIAILLILTFTVFTGGSSKKASVRATPSPSLSSSAVPAAPKTCATFSPNPLAAGVPRVPPVNGPLASRLVEKDFTIGHGRAAKSGDKVTVKYVGYSCDTGKSFDASYTDGAKNKEFSFTLGAGQVIQGWDQGIVGMKTGGVRELIIPASLAYKSQGSGAAIKPNDTLVFLVTLDKV
ncbi:MAG: FKBP-type peptidyl-prolyl cis-trans isomerase [Mycobacteriales bacterium]